MDTRHRERREPHQFAAGEEQAETSLQARIDRAKRLKVAAAEAVERMHRLALALSEMEKVGNAQNPREPKS